MRTLFVTDATGVAGSRIAARLAPLRGLGRPPKDFSGFAREVAASGLWRNVA